MKKIVKAISALLAAVFICTVLISCSSEIRPIEASEQDKKVVGTCDGREVLYDELRYITLSYRYDMEQAYGKDIWDDPDGTYAQKLSEYVYYAIRTNYALLSLCDEYGVELEQEDIDEYAQYMVESQVKTLGSFDAYKQSLKDYYLTDRYVRFNYGMDMRSEALIQKLAEQNIIVSNSVTGGEDGTSDFLQYTKDKDNYARVIQVYTSSEQDARTMYSMLKQGKKMSDIIGSRYNQDYGDTTGDGYYFARGEKAQKYENQVFALSIGQVSEVFECDGMYYIVQRLEPQESYIKSHIDTLYSYYRYAVLNVFVRERMDKLTFVPNEYGESLVLTEMK